MIVFLDTNVLLDWFLEREKFYYAAATLLSLADQKTIDIAVSSMSLVTANYICCERNKLKDDEWAAKMRVLEIITNVCPVTKSNIFDVIALGWKDYEDAVQYHVCKSFGCDVLVTRNVKDFALSDIPIKTPEEMIDCLLGNNNA